MPTFDKNPEGMKPSGYKMKSSPATKLWPFGKTKRSKSVVDGVENKNKTTTIGNTTITKNTTKLLAGEESKNGVWNTKNKTKTKNGEVVKSKNVVIDKDGQRKTKTVTKRGKTKKVVTHNGVRTVTRS